MEPRFHTGDLALIRSAARYRVGDVVAYRSRLLRTVVLHRIIGRRGDRYVFKGDNNDFVDPIGPRRSDLIGRLWLRVPRGGVVLGWLHAPALAALLLGGAALSLVWGGGRRRRRRRRRTGPGKGDPAMTASPSGAPPAWVPGPVPIAFLTVAGAFVLLAVVAFAHPTTRQASVKTPFTEAISVGYSAQLPQSSPVYPKGAVTTGDPIFLKLVRQLRLTARYRFAAGAEHAVAGSMSLSVRVSSPTGWSRTTVLAAPARFTGDTSAVQATLDLERLRSLLARVEALSGAPSGGDYTVSVIPHVQASGRITGQPFTTDYRPAVGFQLSPLQLRAGSTPANGGAGGPKQSRRGAVTTTRSTPSELSAWGLGIPVGTARWIALAGLVLACGGWLLAGINRRRHPRDTNAEIRARYGRLIVPIAGTVQPSAGEPIDVTTIDALAQLAERGERLILHHEGGDASTYFVDDEGTIYRYRSSAAGRGR
jgi:hypothetical protein